MKKQKKINKIKNDDIIFRNKKIKRQKRKQQPKIQTKNKDSNIEDKRKTKNYKRDIRKKIDNFDKEKELFIFIKGSNENISKIDILTLKLYFIKLKVKI